jgi:hypothetical protein
MPVVVRQLVLPRPPRDLLRLAIRLTVAVLLASIPLLQEPLILALQLVVEDDAPKPTVLAAEAFLASNATLRAVDLVNTLALPNQFALAPPRQIEILHEHVMRILSLVSVAFAGAAAVTSAPVP